MNRLKPLVLEMLLLLACSNLSAREFTIYYDFASEPIGFAAKELKEAFANNECDVFYSEINDFENAPKGDYVILVNSDDAMNNLFIKRGKEYDLKSEAFQMHSMVINDKIGYHIFGGGDVGVMYGGLQLAENLNLYGLKVFDQKEEPKIKNRGIKFNIPFDKRSPTYYSSGFSINDFRGTSTRLAIKHIWDIDFWSEMFDFLARNRYNAFSMWSLHPFTSMIKLSKYPEAALQDVEGFDGFAKVMTMEEKIKHWRQVMKLARDRGIDFYIYNWNIYTYGATGKYGIDNKSGNPATIEYMKACIKALFETYPDLTGFGVTAGENMGEHSNEEEAKWMWQTYGSGAYEYALDHPERPIVFIHRYHGSGADEVLKNFKPLEQLPNVRFDFSFKYAVAHIYSVTKPEWIRTRYGDVPGKMKEIGKKTWLELRNDDFYYLHWGDPDFVKEYLNNFPDEGEVVRGFFMGSDGFTPTRSFMSKSLWCDGLLEMERNWYTWFLWGRLAYNTDLDEQFFIRKLKHHYKTDDSQILFRAWQYASKTVPLFTEVVQGAWKSDFLWYPETCMSRRHGFVTIDLMANTEPPPGSNFCSITNSAKMQCSGKISTFDVADTIEKNAHLALELLTSLPYELETELGATSGKIKAMSYLGLYFSEKLRAATFNEAGLQNKTRIALEKSANYWIEYATLMDRLFYGMDYQRTNALPNWNHLNSEVVKECKRFGASYNSNIE